MMGEWKTVNTKNLTMGYAWTVGQTLPKTFSPDGGTSMTNDKALFIQAR